METVLNLEEGIKYWRATGDEMLSHLADQFEEMGELPTEKELTDLLTFYLTFSMGCWELKLEKESETFNKRADWFLGGLRALGVKEGTYHIFMGNRDLGGLYSRIKKNASLDSSYRMIELRNRQTKWYSRK